MQSKNAQIDVILQGDSKDLRILARYIAALETQNSLLMTQNQELAEELVDLKIENEELRIEKDECRKDLNSSKTMLEGITALFQKIQAKGGRDGKLRKSFWM